MGKKKPKYKSLSEWRKAEPKAYDAAKRSGFLIEICNSFGWDLPSKPKRVSCGHWNIKENVLADAKKYKTKGEWAKSGNSGSAYNSAKKNGWFEEATAHMIEGSTPAGYWTKERCMKSAEKYTNISDWIKNDKKVYNKAKEKGFLDECVKHMFFNITPYGHWNIKENVLADAKKYKTKGEWAKAKNSSSAYNSAKKNGWFEEATAHMIEGCTPAGYWTKEKVLAEAKKYATKKEWINNSIKSYQAALRNLWLGECHNHMVENRKASGYWTKEKVLAEAKKYTTKKEWQKNSNGSMKSARRNDWFEEATAHMIKF